MLSPILSLKGVGEKMKLFNVKYVREPRSHNKQYVYQRKVPKHLQKYDRGRNNKPRSQIEVELGTTEAEAVESYPSVHERIEMTIIIFP